MAERLGTVIVHITPGTPRIGIWCNKCMTSGGYEVDAYTMGADGPHLLCTVRRCSTCQPFEDDE